MGAGKDKHILLVVDKPGWHTGKEFEVPEGIHVEFLPSGSPELHSAKRLWPLTNEVTANWLFEEISEMEQALVERCVEPLDQTEISKISAFMAPLMEMARQPFPQALVSSSRSEAPLAFF